MKLSDYFPNDPKGQASAKIIGFFSMIASLDHTTDAICLLKRKQEKLEVECKEYIKSIKAQKFGNIPGDSNFDDFKKIIPNSNYLSVDFVNTRYQSDKIILELKQRFQIYIDTNTHFIRLINHIF